jgi:hypothetical protein
VCVAGPKTRRKRRTSSARASSSPIAGGSASAHVAFPGMTVTSIGPSARQNPGRTWWLWQPRHHGSSPSGRRSRIAWWNASRSSGPDASPSRAAAATSSSASPTPNPASVTSFAGAAPTSAFSPASSSGTNAAVNTRASARGTTYGEPRNALTCTTSSGIGSSERARSAHAAPHPGGYSCRPIAATAAEAPTRRSRWCPATRNASA